MLSLALLVFVLLSLLGLCLGCPKSCRCLRDVGEVRCDLSTPEMPTFSGILPIYRRLVLRNCSLTRADLRKPLASLSRVTEVDLSWNQLTTLTAVVLPEGSSVRKLDLSHNRISRLDLCTAGLCGLEELSLRSNVLRNLSTEPCAVKGRSQRCQLAWKRLDMSSNSLRHLDLAALLNRAPLLTHLNVADNQLQTFGPTGPRSVRPWRLQSLVASGNAFTTFSLPGSAPALRHLDLHGNGQLRRLDYASLRPVTQLDLSECAALSEFDSAAELWSLRELDLSGCLGLFRLDLSMFPHLTKVSVVRSNVSSLLPPIAWLSGNAGVLDTRLTTNWNCSCDILWLTSFRPASTALCAEPGRLRGHTLPRTLPDCEQPVIRNFTSQSVYGLGEKAKLECRVGGHPHPMVLWTTPSEKVFVYREPTTHKFHTAEETQGSLFHRAHPWHGSHLYRHQLSDDRRLFYILTDGSLYIDYVTRLDAGAYSCTVLGPNGNVSLTMQLSLNYDILRAVRWHSQIVGMVCAGCMLGIGFAVGVVKMVARRCRTLEREKHHRTLKVLIENLETYRADKVDRFRAYRTTKIDRLKDNYSGQMSRIKDSCLSHMVTMQEHYNRRIVKIRENYVIRIEGLRDSYASQVLRIKDYRSHHVDRLRENYNQQLLRIREYASAQLVRLREQYRLQQQLFIKLMEALSLENCMAVDVEELDEAISRGATVGMDSDDDADDIILNEHLPSARALTGHDVEMNVIDSLPSLPTLDLDFFVNPCGDTEAAESPLRSGSPVSDDYQTADSDYEIAVNQVVVCMDYRSGRGDSPSAFCLDTRPIQSDSPLLLDPRPGQDEALANGCPDMGHAEIDASRHFEAAIA